MDISFFTRQSFGDAARFLPQNAALAFDDGRFLTYEELAHKANRYANALLSLDVAPGDRVGILLYNCTEYWIAYFAITRIGAIAVRLNFRLMAEELEYALTDSGATVLLATPDLIERVEGRRAALPVRHYIALDDGSSIPAWVRPWSDLEAGAADEPPIALPLSETPAMLMYTSGTTGRPKGALWSHGSTTSWTAMQIMEWGLTAQSVTMVTGPMYHIGALENYALPTLAVGGRVVILRSRNFDIRQTLEIASKQQVTDILLFPSMIYQMLQDPEIGKLDLSRIRRVFSGGDPLLPSAIEQMRDRFGWMDIVQVYGLTEGTPIVACSGPGQSRERPETVGRAFPFAELSVRDDNGAVLSHGQVGEIWTRSAANALGYWRKPDATATTFVDGWCKTGDLGKIENGVLRIAGRKKDMIRSGGENINPGEIENLLLRHPKIADAAVVGIPDPRYTEAVCAVVVLAGGQQMSEQDVIDHCSNDLAGYKRPRKVVFVDELPRTASQKIIKYELRHRLSGEADQLA
ncbi:MAG: class I adenylate-forming enzyme family protein [Afipia sp.]